MGTPDCPGCSNCEAVIPQHEAKILALERPPSTWSRYSPPSPPASTSSIATPAPARVAERETAAALAGPYAEDHAVVAGAGVKSVEETGWTEAGKKRWRGRRRPPPSHTPATRGGTSPPSVTCSAG